MEPPHRSVYGRVFAQLHVSRRNGRRGGRRWDHPPGWLSHYARAPGSVRADAPLSGRLYCLRRRPGSRRAMRRRRADEFLPYISAHTVVAEIGAYTAPGTWPAYVYAEQFVFGVGGNANPIFPQEAVEKIFGDFFSTDFSQLVDIYSEDVNSTTGTTSHRFYGTSDPFGPPLGGLKS